MHLGTGARSYARSTVMVHITRLNFPERIAQLSFLSLDFLSTRALSCSHYEQQLSCAQLPPPTHTQRKPLCKLLLPVLGVAPSRSIFFLAIVSLDDSFVLTPIARRAMGQHRGSCQHPAAA